MQKKQATGVDTRMMVPVYAAVFAIICQCFLPWISIPVLKYSKLPFTYTVFRLDTCLQNIQICIQTNEKMDMAPLTEAQMAPLEHICGGMKVASIVLMGLLALCAVLVLVKKGKSRPQVQGVFAVLALFTLVQGGALIAGNVFLNTAMDRPNNFLNLSIYSYLQLTSWVYAQMILAVALVFLAPRLMDVTRETAPQKYTERTMRTDHRMGRRTKVTLFLIVVAIPLVIFFGIFFLNDRSNVFIGLCIVLLAMVPFGMVFEDRNPQARELLLIAVLAAIAVVGRTAFFMVPQFKPMTAIVIIAGVGLGPEAGFLTGAISGFVSNFFFGQGPWTPWQMFAYGIIGFIAGLLFSRYNTKKIRTKWGEKIYMVVLCTFGFLATFVIYGLVMDFSSALTFTKDFSWPVLLAKIASGVIFNLIHAVSTVIFLLFLARPMQRKLDRIKKKYGILQA